ncbi:hypothetical protein N665_1242s0005 [Sinapis alba]|nr:hypothetical protein N665_1242s0005 [Sinapis alba]
MRRFIISIGYAAPYAHWAEVLLLGPAIAPGHMITFWLWIVIRQIEAIETHSGYDFPWTLTKYIPFYGLQVPKEASSAADQGGFQEEQRAEWRREIGVLNMKLLTLVLVSTW